MEDDSPWEPKVVEAEVAVLSEYRPAVAQKMVAGALTPSHVGKRVSLYDDKGDYYHGEIQSYSVTTDWKGKVRINMTLTDKKSHHYLNGIDPDDLMELLS